MTCPTLELVFFRLPERPGSSSPGDKLLCVRFVDLVGERERERERGIAELCNRISVVGRHGCLVDEDG